MTMRRGRCNNIGLCENATRQRTIEVPEGEPFVCPKCEAELVPIGDRKSQRSGVAVALPVVAISLAAVGVAYGVWDLYGHPAAPPAPQAMAPAQPQTEAAATPVPASSVAPANTPAPEAASPAPSSATLAPAPTPEPALATPPPQTASATPPEAAAPALAASPAQSTPPATPPASVAPAPEAAATPQVAEAAQAQAAPAPTPVPVAQPATAAAAGVPPAGAPPAAVPLAASPPAAEAALAAADPAKRVQAFLGNATRVPITFNFRPSMVALTGHGERELDRLVSYLKQHHATGDRVYLAGFTDNQGDPASNEEVSQKRVAAVAAALTDVGITPAHVASFGSAMPVSDNSTQAGRDRNRRVEVYLAP